MSENQIIQFSAFSSKIHYIMIVMRMCNMMEKHLRNNLNTSVCNANVHILVFINKL